MQVKIVTLHFSTADGRFDESPLAHFLADHDLIECREHFFVAGGVPHLACVLLHGDRGRDESTPAHRATQAPSLTATQRTLYEHLRKWRKARAERDGVPAYTILTNTALEELARARPTTKAALLSIKGIGQQKAERHGTALLEQICNHRSDEQAS